MDQEKAILERIEGSRGFEKFKALIEYATYFRQSDLSKSIEYAHKAREFARACGNLDFEVEALISEAFANLYHNKYEESERAADEIFLIGSKMKNPKVMGITYLIKGRIAMNHCEVPKALEFYLKNLDYLLQKPDNQNLMICYNNIGTCYQETKDNAKALHYFQMAYEIAEKEGVNDRYIIKFNIACIHFSNGDAQDAYDSYFESKEYFESRNMQNNLADAYLNMGLCLIKLERTTEALELFQKSKQLKETLKDSRGICKSSYQIASYLNKHGKYREAKQYLDHALDLALAEDFVTELIWIYREFEIHWAVQKKYKELSEVRSKIIELSDKLNERQHNEKILELETKYKTEIYKLKTEELDRTNQSLKEQIEKLRKVQQDLNAKLEETSQMLEKQENLLGSQSRSALMGEMVSLIAHQWRQPLNIISVLIQSFDEAWEYDEMTREYTKTQVKLIMDQILYMSETISDFRNFFKAQSSIRFDLSEVISKALSLEAYMLKQNNIELVKDLASGCELFGNPNEIIQVIMNLVNNAKDAMKSANIEKPMIFINATKCDTECKITIFNKGSQIPGNVMDKIFEPYFTTKGDAGTGIGLYICKMIIENKYNGRIEAVNSSEGVEFQIYFPLFES